MFQNQVTLETITMHRAQAPYVLESIDWDMPSVTPTTYRVPHQIGESLSGIVVGTRKPLLTGYVIANTMADAYKNVGWKEYYALQLEEIKQNKKILSRVFNIYQNILISVDGYYMRVRPTSPVKYSTDEVTNNNIMCMFSIELECYEEPLFYNKTKIIDLVTIKGMFKFPMTLTEDATDEFVAFGEIERGVAKEIINNGDIPVGCTITVEANGGNVQNPKVYDISTGIGIELTYNIQNGQRVIFTTEIGHETAILHQSNGAENIMVGYLSKASEFFQIKQGTSYYIATAKSGLNNMFAKIEFVEKYFAIETM